MRNVSANQDSVILCQNEWKNCVTEVFNSKKIKIAASVVIVGFLLVLLGLFLFLLCSTAPLPVTISTAIIGMIILFCGLVLSIAFYHRKAISQMAGPSLDVPTLEDATLEDATLEDATLEDPTLEDRNQMETTLKCVEENLSDLKNKIQLLSKESPIFKERLESLSIGFVDRSIEIHCKLSEKFHEALQTGMFLKAETAVSLKGEIESLENNYNLSSEAVNLNFELHHCIKDVKDFCQRVGCSQKDTEAILKDLRELQEKTFEVSENILTEESITLSGIASYKKEFEEFFKDKFLFYNFIVTQTGCLKDLQNAGGWSVFQERFHADINEVASVMKALPYHLLIILVKKIQKKLNTELKNSPLLTEKFVQERLDNLSRLKESLSLVVRSSKDCPIKGGLKPIEQLCSFIASINRISAESEGGGRIARWENRIQRKIYEETLGTISRLRISDWKRPFPPLLKQTLKENKVLLEAKANNYTKLLRSLSPLICCFGHFIEEVESDKRDVLIPDLYSLVDSIAGSNNVLLSIKEDSCLDESTLLENLSRLNMEFSSNQESYLCDKGQDDHLRDLMGRMAGKSAEDSSLILEEFVQEITEKMKNLPPKENFPILDKEEALLMSVEEVLRDLGDSVKVFSELVALFKQRAELKALREDKNLTRQDKRNLNRKLEENKSAVHAMKAVFDIEFQNKFFKDKKKQKVGLEAMTLIIEFYHEAQSWLRTIFRQANWGCTLNLLNTIPSVDLKPSNYGCRELICRLNKDITTHQEIIRSLKNLGAIELCEEVSDLCFSLVEAKFTLEDFLKENRLILD